MALSDYLIERGLTPAQWEARELAAALLLVDLEDQLGAFPLANWTDSIAYYDAGEFPYGRMVIGDTDGVAYRFIGDPSNDEEENDPESDSYDGNGLGTYWKIVTPLSGLGGSPPILTEHTSSGTHTYDSGAKFAIVEVWGGGGGGGGGRTGSTGTGGSGASGAYARFVVDVAGDSIASATITIGAAGAAGASSADAGDGGDSTYNDGTNNITAGGGEGGIAPTTGSTAAAGGTVTGSPEVSIDGFDGSIPDVNGAQGNDVNGRDAPMGAGTGGRYYAATDPDGKDASGYGSGGASGGYNDSTAVESGGAGAPGKITILEYI